MNITDYKEDYTYKNFYNDVCAILQNSKDINYEKKSKLDTSLVTLKSEKIKDEAKNRKRSLERTSESIGDELFKKQKLERVETNKRYYLSENLLPALQQSYLGDINSNLNRFSSFLKIADLSPSQNWDERELTYLVFFVEKLEKCIPFNLFDEIIAKYGYYFNNRDSNDLRNKYENLLKDDKILYEYLKIKAKFLKEETIHSSHVKTSEEKSWDKTEISHLVFFVGKLGFAWNDISMKYGKYFRKRNSAELKNKYYNLRETNAIFQYFQKKADLLEGMPLKELSSFEVQEHEQEQKHIKNKSYCNEIEKSKVLSCDTIQNKMSGHKIFADEGYICHDYWQRFAYPFIANIQAVENVNLL